MKFITDWLFLKHIIMFTATSGGKLKAKMLCLENGNKIHNTIVKSENSILIFLVFLANTILYII